MEQLEKVIILGKAIFKFMEANDNCTNEDMMAELSESNKMTSEVKPRLLAIYERLADTHEPVLPPSTVLPPSPGTMQGN